MCSRHAEPYAAAYLGFGLDLADSDHGPLGRILLALLVHLATHPGHGVAHLLLHPRHLQLVQVLVLLILGETRETQ